MVTLKVDKGIVLPLNQLIFKQITLISRLDCGWAGSLQYVHCGLDCGLDHDRTGNLGACSACS